MSWLSRLVRRGASANPPPNPSAARQRAIPLVLMHEGGYVNHARDNGGCTNRGITIATLRTWRGDPNLTCQDVRLLSEMEAREIYRALYWNVVRADDLPMGVGYVTFDFAVHSGPARAARALQAAAGVNNIDGVIGPQSLAAVQRANPDTLLVMLKTRRMAFLREHEDWDVFGKGWTRRVDEVFAAARDMRKS